MDDDSSTFQPPTPLDNSGATALRVPGFNDIPIHHALPPDARFAHGINEWRQAPAVIARELAMVSVMNQLSDRAGWEGDVFDEGVVSAWRETFIGNTPLISESAWSWCVRELRDKAAYFRENGFIRVLDTGSCVCKSDTEALDVLAGVFRREVVPLREEHRCSTSTFSLVDPLLYPLVYGRSQVLTDGGKVDLHDMFGSYGQATTAPEHFDRREDSAEVQKQIDDTRYLDAGVNTVHFDSMPEFYAGARTTNVFRARWSSAPG